MSIIPQFVRRKTSGYNTSSAKGTVAFQIGIARNEDITGGMIPDKQSQR